MLAFALPAGASVSVQSSSPSIASLKLGTKATIEANGAVVLAPSRLKCLSGYSGSAELNIYGPDGGLTARDSHTVHLTN